MGDYTMSALKKFMKEVLAKQEVFDPTSKLHLQSYYALKYEGKKVRSFELEHPFVDVLHMMEHKISRQVLIEKFGSEFKYDY